MKPFLLAMFVGLAALAVAVWRWPIQTVLSPLASPRPLWAVRSIDTMKYSRDLAREKANDSAFDQVIDLQVSQIASAGASHVAIATPYDPEFVPFLTRWVAAARRHGLSVWFRGNLAGWEGWFDRPRMSRVAHTEAINSFIRNNGALFEEGDIFTPCPECENGGPGDPRRTGDIPGYRNFLVGEYQAASAAFRAIGKNVAVGYFSMNYDVARAVMDKPTTEALGGVVAIDHYVLTPEQLVADVQSLKTQSGGQIFLGEFGVPIPDIHGKMSEDEQSDWIRRALELLRTSQSVVGLNYWVNVGGSTELWKSDGSSRFAASVISAFYHRLEIAP